MAVKPQGAQLDLLNRGQGWVARRLAEALPRIADAALHEELSEMLDAHVRNIRQCNELIARSS
jgi:nitronate monooxygenase